MKVQKVRFNGLDFILTSPGESTSPLTTKETFRNGECSYAQVYFTDNNISRFGTSIGKATDIVLGEMIDLNVNELDFISGICGNTWPF